MFRHLLIAAFAAGFAVMTPPASANEVLRIGWMRAPNDIMLAKIHGSLEKALAPLGVDVAWVGPFATAAPAFEALNAKTVDITVGSSTSAISGLAARMPLVIFAYQKMSAASQAILIKRGSSIKSIADLAGKSVAVNRGGTGEYLLMRALATHHVDPAGVKRIYLSPADSAAAFATDHVDAWATWDPFVTLARKSYDAELLADGAAIGSDNAVVSVASRDLATKEPQVLRAVFDVLEAENAWATAHPAEAGAVWVDSMGLPADLALAIGTGNAVPTRAVTAADVVEIGAIADWMHAEGIVTKTPDVAGGVWLLKP